MNTWTRRTLIGVGTALLVGGWGSTRYAHAQQQSVSARIRANQWIVDRGVFRRGVVAMALGAGLIGFCAIGTRKETE